MMIFATSIRWTGDIKILKVNLILMSLYDVEKDALDKIETDFAYNGRKIGSKVVTNVQENRIMPF